MRLRSLILALLLAPAALGQVVSPAPPKNFHVEIRYRIEADRDGRVRIFRAMQGELKALDFVADAREDADLDILDAGADRLSGTMPSVNLEKLLHVTAVQTVLVWPEGGALPADPTHPTQISVSIATGLDRDTQRDLYEQVHDKLIRLGFINGVGYDDRHFTRLRGSIPAGTVLTLLKDLRGLPAGWLLQETPRSRLPLPIRSVLPIRLIEVLPDLAAPPRVAPIASVSPKYTADLRLALADTSLAGKPLRVEAALNVPIDDHLAFRTDLKAKHPGISLEGVIGPLVTFLAATPKDLEKLATEPNVRSLRLPPMASGTVKASTSAGNALSATNIVELQSRGYRGVGRKIVVIAGAYNLAKTPPKAVLIDLTPELSPTIEASPMNAAFDGTAAALAAQAAAPDASILMVRIDPAAFHQLFTVAKAVLGDFTLSVAQASRADSMMAEYDTLSRRRDYVTKEYTDAMTDLRDDERPKLRREKAKADYEAFRVDEIAFTAKYDRMDSFRKDVMSLAGATAIANTLVWDEGYPADGLSDFARFLDEKFAPVTKRNASASNTPTWVQAASESTWSVWAGPAHDRDGNHVLEFADDSVKPPQGLWNRELNFLGMLADNGEFSSDLPAGTKIRISVQWREPHDSHVQLSAEPIVNFTLQLLRQYDPTGGKVATDEFALVAKSEGQPVRLMLSNSAGVYEQSMEVVLPEAGRYTLRVNVDGGSVSRFATETQLAEINPKIVVRPVGVAKSRVVFANFMAARPGVGVPGDSATAFTVGRADAKGRSLSLLGAGPGLQLRNKPDALLFGDGSGAAAATIAGFAANLAEIGVRPSQFIGTMAIQANGMMAIPSAWIQQLPAKP